MQRGKLGRREAERRGHAEAEAAEAVEAARAEAEEVEGAAGRIQAVQRGKAGRRAAAARREAVCSAPNTRAVRSLRGARHQLHGESPYGSNTTVQNGGVPRVGGRCSPLTPRP
jgi:hypothetical protein